MMEKEDKLQLDQRGIALKTVEKQIERFKKGFPFMEITKPAIIGDGITYFSESEEKNYIDYYTKKLAQKQVMKFTPASGAASRMFKALFEFLTTYRDSDNSFDKLMDGDSEVKKFITGIEKFAFYDVLNQVCLKNDNCTIDEAIKEKKASIVVKNLLSEEGLNYGNLPKALILFHNYPDSPRTAFEEHLVEGANYGKDADNVVELTFTVSEEHEKLFETLFNQVKEDYEKRFGVKYKICYTTQKPSTDTIAVDMENKPFRNSDGTLLFRPGGHGALISNLNEIDADLIFIKNIDNVAPDHQKENTARYKKVLGGVMIEKQTEIFSYIQRLQSNCTKDLMKEIAEYMKNVLCVELHAEYAMLSNDKKKEFLLKKLNRPIRVCGMVKNDGEPGGGPFWTINSDDTKSLQIVESAQIDLNSPEARAIVDISTHFNPVDLVCGIKDYTGKKFDLLNFTDENTGFISKKSKDGRELKALELPGLWNGAMSDWNTIFVEVPLNTFNPVKTVNDLIKPNHQ